MRKVDRLIIELPHPPSVNGMYKPRSRRSGMSISSTGKRYFKAKRLSGEAVTYRENVWARVLDAGSPRFGTARLGVSIKWWLPNNGEHDTDNSLKATFDALEAAQVYKRDSQIDLHSVEKCGVVTDGKMLVRIWDKSTTDLAERVSAMIDEEFSALEAEAMQ